MLVALLATAFPAAAQQPLASATAADACPPPTTSFAAGDPLGYVQPQGVASLEGSPTWLAGVPVSPAAVQRPAIARWSDGQWSEVPVPFTSYGGFNAVSSWSSSVAWAVGSINADAPRPISARWNGTAWLRVEVPRPAGQMTTLTDVLATGAASAWAVGTRMLNGRLLPVAFQFNGTKWVNRSPSIGLYGEGGLSAIALSPNGRIWAAGWRTVNGTPRPWVLRRAASRWRVIPHGLSAPGTAMLSDLAFRTASEAWAVGHREDAQAGTVPVIQRWNGTKWLPDPSPLTEPPGTLLRSAAVDAAGTLIVGGATLSGGQPRAVLSARPVGGTWQVEVLPASSYPGSWVSSVAGLATGAVSVGWADDHAFSALACQLEAAAGLGYPAPLQTTALPHDESAGTTSSPASGSRLAIPSTAALPGLTPRDMTSDAGLEMTISTFAGVVADFNDDDWPDVFINGHLSPSRLMLGGEAGFTDAGVEFAADDRHGCSAADVDGSGLPDLICSIGRGKGTQVRGHELILDPAGDGPSMGFEFGVSDPFARGQEALLFDLDGDPWPDLYTTTKARRADGMPSFNRLYRNDGGAGFASLSNLGQDRSLGGRCLTSADIDGDHDEDLLVCATERTGSLAAGLRVLRNEGGVPVDRTTALGLAPMADVAALVADFDMDGRADVAQLGNGRLRVSRGTPGGFTTILQLSVPQGFAMASGDVNGDGAPDLYIVRSTAANDGHLMLVSDGTGASFTSISIPQAAAGSADDVLALDYDRNGLTDFLVLNGRFEPGPIRLIAFFDDGLLTSAAHDHERL